MIYARLFEMLKTTSYSSRTMNPFQTVQCLDLNKSWFSSNCVEISFLPNDYFHRSGNSDKWREFP